MRCEARFKIKIHEFKNKIEITDFCGGGAFLLLFVFKSTLTLWSHRDNFVIYGN